MTYANASIVLLILLPAVVGWLSILGLVWRWHNARQSRLRVEAYREIVAAKAAARTEASIADIRDTIRRTRELRAVALWSSPSMREPPWPAPPRPPSRKAEPDVEIVTLHDDGPRAA